MTEEPVKKILVVDDEKIMRFFLSDVLSDAGYNVGVASNGMEALDLTRKLQPDLIILDIVLPDIGGSDVAFRLKTNPSTTKIPIIFLSGIITKNQEESAPETDIMQYIIAKPVDRKELLEAVSKVLSR